jgi:hypothetical protein
MAAMTKTVLIIVDPQVDFHPGGSLGIPGADEDSARIADLITSKGNAIDEIYVTLDSHHRLHLAHAVCWTNAAGESPAPFTLIKNADIKAGLWVPKVVLISSPPFLSFLMTGSGSEIPGI